MPLPSIVLVAKVIVGFGAVLQQIPLAVMGVPPSLVISPPQVALVFVTFDIELVVRVANCKNGGGGSSQSGPVCLVQDKRKTEKNNTQ